MIKLCGNPGLKLKKIKNKTCLPYVLQLPTCSHMQDTALWYIFIV